MSRCFGCASKFGLFRREHGCPNCQKAFCSACLGYKAIIPLQSAEKDVCRTCYNDLTKKRQVSGKLDKGNGMVQLPEDPPPYSGPSLQRQTVAGNSQIQDDPDLEIRERLAKLKETNEPGHEKHTDASIAEKFASVTGRMPGSAHKSDILTPRPKLSEQEEINRLMEQANAEANIDSNVEENAKPEKNTNDDIEKRLLMLKGIDPDKVKEQEKDLDSSEDEAEQTARILRKAIAEAAIDEKVKNDGYGNLVSGEDDDNDHKLKLPKVPKTVIGAAATRFTRQCDDDSDEDDELPWCCICNADATVRCHGCDDDLYCRRCYKEGHSNFDFEDHKTSHFRPKKKKCK